MRAVYFLALGTWAVWSLAVPPKAARARQRAPPTATVMSAAEADRVGFEGGGSILSSSVVALEDCFSRPGLDETRRLLREYALSDATLSGGSSSSGDAVTQWLGWLIGLPPDVASGASVADDEMPTEAPLDEAALFQTAWREVRSALSLGTANSAAASAAREATKLLVRWATRLDRADARMRVKRGVAVAKYIGQTPFGQKGAVVAAALLCDAHEAIDGVSNEVVRDALGGDAAGLLQSLSNVEQLSRLQRARWDAEGAARWGGCADDAECPAADDSDDALLHSCRLPATHASNLQHMLVAVAGDNRALPVLLARRMQALHEECAAGATGPSSLARDALDVHAPLAERFGWYGIKNDLEDAAFERLAPATRQRIIRALDATREERSTVLEDVSTRLRRLILEDDVLINSVNGLRIWAREKEPFSIWRKQQKLRRRRRAEDASFEAAESDAFTYPLDTIALRVVLEQTESPDRAATVALGERLCYRALALVHQTWPALPNRTKDYVASPKSNGYQSLHTTVRMRLHGASYPFEVQIRTLDMHIVAEFGSAAHVVYSRPHPPRRDHFVLGVADGDGGTATRRRRLLIDRPARSCRRSRYHRGTRVVARSNSDPQRSVNLDEPFRVKKVDVGAGDRPGDAASYGTRLAQSLGDHLRAEHVFILASGGRVVTVHARSNVIDAVDALIRDVAADAGEKVVDNFLPHVAGPMEINGRPVEWLASLSTKLFNGDEVEWVERQP